MKRFVVVLAIACTTAITSTAGFSQTASSPDTQERKHIGTTMPNGTPLTFVANSIEKNWVTSVVHLKGDVLVEIHASKSPTVTVLHADEVDYDANTGDLTPRGNVNLTVRARR